MLTKFLDVLLGEPLSNEQGSHEKYNVPFGLAIMASDAVSSVAYAAQEILFVLIVLGAAAYQWLTWTSFMIIGLLIILTISYIQIIRAYPQGGGAYKVASENISSKAGLVAGAGLIIDYLLTVAVSASAGADAIISAFSSLAQYKVPFVLIIIIVLTILNLRGISESSKIFAIPTYIFIFSMIFMIIYGLFKYLVLGIHPEPVFSAPLHATESLSIFLVLRAFSSGCSALTGLESVSNSVPNFKEPSTKNAKIVMILLAFLIFFIFGGTSILAIFYTAMPIENGPTVISQIATAIFGNSIMYYIIQFSTAIILLMACNTAYTGFPMLMYIVGKDGYAPRQFTIRGKRLSFSFGIAALSFIACFLVIIFKADTHSLIPLYAIGVFTSFTLGQFGMVNHWRNEKEKGWLKRAIINGCGAIVSLVTTIIILVEKFKEGAFIVAILIPIIILVQLKIKHHYDKVANGLSISQLNLKKVDLRKKYTHIVVVPIASLNKATIGALQYAQSISDNVIALNISTDKVAMERLKTRWDELDTDILLVSKYSPFRAVVTPLLKNIELIANSAAKDEKITVVVPQFITHERFGEVLHNHTSFFIRETLLKNDNIIVSTFPYHLMDECEHKHNN
ncbi:amino acid transporter [Clostridium saccharoperbutylacetonicum]|uniref:Amino acid/polyamine/organocation transporter, APC superfamily n=1 Tax=Clostridium saccharoperbutylacetonicum N1-4(HMT) TaxID=931276 RepID=M1MRG1_9CLOT|nr:MULTISPECIES: APC family permease [Clostridium]AGF57331.1 amino acid/polyamine/organocation transporter, APC superfamily [Clostridium saccharoperbutylacetonicum N1-4(HMT)]NRT61906.1 amino acid transporter [Clostridium saccharoperbutylacetonicum]NSB25234.1 amino acid transporter [Clostridium saccharoperbutylacetonicum]NSB44604.1 amino acid transporter [Clostridium saccharoperbutylacetonicum]